jgi:hypothetical protein
MCCILFFKLCVTASHDEDGEEAFGEEVRCPGGRAAGENLREHRERSAATILVPT